MKPRTARAVWRTDWFRNYVGRVWVKSKGTEAWPGMVIVTSIGPVLLMAIPLDHHFINYHSEADLSDRQRDGFRWTPSLPPEEIKRKAGA